MCQKIVRLNTFSWNMTTAVCILQYKCTPLVTDTDAAEFLFVRACFGTIGNIHFLYHTEGTKRVKKYHLEFIQFLSKHSFL